MEDDGSEATNERAAGVCVTCVPLERDGGSQSGPRKPVAAAHAYVRFAPTTRPHSSRLSRLAVRGSGEKCVEGARFLAPARTYRAAEKSLELFRGLSGEACLTVVVSTVTVLQVQLTFCFFLSFFLSFLNVAFGAAKSFFSSIPFRSSSDDEPSALGHAAPFSFGITVVGKREAVLLTQARH